MGRGSPGAAERVAITGPALSHLEETLSFQMQAAELPAPEREYSFFPGRKWRADFAWPTRRLLVEVEGGVYSGGRHTTGPGFERDCEKYNAAALSGWVVLRFTGRLIESGEALTVIENALMAAIK
jgi:hypothetical protein